MKRLLFLSVSLTAMFVQARPAQECLGRLSFSVPNPANFEWALAADELPIANKASFGGDMMLPYDQWDYGTNLNVMTTQPTDGTAFQRQWRSYMPSNAELKLAQDDVSTLKRMIDNGEKTQQELKEKDARGEKYPPAWKISDEWIEDLKKDLVEAQVKLNEMENRQIPVVKFDDIPDEAYTVNYPQQRAFVRKNGRDYMFYLSNLGGKKWGFPETDATVEQIHAILKRFEPRKLGEVPKTLGFCFPYGFIRDDGEQDYAIKNSFRFKDQPNVAYVIYTGNNTRLSRGQIATHGVIHTRMPTVYKGYQGNPVEQTLTLKNGNTLTLKGWEITEKIPKDPEHHYWVYGELKQKTSTPNDPFVAIQIDAFVKNPELGRPNNAPSLNEAIKRLIPIIETIK